MVTDGTEGVGAVFIDASRGTAMRYNETTRTYVRCRRLAVTLPSVSR